MSPRGRRPSGSEQGKGVHPKGRFASPDGAAPPPRAKLYTADLESGLHYLLRVELAAHRSLAGAELRTLKDFVTVVAKVCVASTPGRGSACGHGARDALPHDLRGVCA